MGWSGRSRGGKGNSAPCHELVPLLKIAGAEGMAKHSPGVAALSRYAQCRTAGSAAQKKHWTTTNLLQ